MLRYQSNKYDLASFINSLSHRELPNFFRKYMLIYKGNEYGLICFINSSADTDVINYFGNILTTKLIDNTSLIALYTQVCLFLFYFYFFVFITGYQNKESDRRFSLLAFETQMFFNYSLKHVVRNHNNESD